jgi:hypothetical protein
VKCQSAHCQCLGSAAVLRCELKWQLVPRLLQIQRAHELQWLEPFSEVADDAVLGIDRESLAGAKIRRLILKCYPAIFSSSFFVVVVVLAEL